MLPFLIRSLNILWYKRTIVDCVADCVVGDKIVAIRDAVAVGDAVDVAVILA
jgi:hypothetical protein